MALPGSKRPASSAGVLQESTPARRARVEEAEQIVTEKVEIKGETHKGHGLNYEERPLC